MFNNKNGAFYINSSRMFMHAINLSSAPAFAVHPVLYLRVNVMVVNGEWSKENPYKLGI